MNILIKTILLTSLLFLAGCAHHSRSYAGHSSHAGYDISIETHIPYHSYHSYQDDVYLYQPKRYNNSRYDRHYNHDTHDRSAHYKHKNHKKHNTKKSARAWRKGGKDSRHGEYGGRY